jgi:hypothetical protein
LELQHHAASRPTDASVHHLPTTSIARVAIHNGKLHELEQRSAPDHEKEDERGSAWIGET